LLRIGVHVKIFNLRQSDNGISWYELFWINGAVTNKVGSFFEARAMKDFGFKYNLPNDDREINNCSDLACYYLADYVGDLFK